MREISLHANVQLTNFNAFMTAQEQGMLFTHYLFVNLYSSVVCSMLRVDGMNINHRPNESLWEVNGIKVLHLNHLPAVSEIPLNTL